LGDHSKFLEFDVEDGLDVPFCVDFLRQPRRKAKRDGLYGASFAWMRQRAYLEIALANLLMKSRMAKSLVSSLIVIPSCCSLAMCASSLYKKINEVSLVALRRSVHPYSSDLFLAMALPSFLTEITLSRGDSGLVPGRRPPFQKWVLSAFMAHSTAASKTCLDNYRAHAVSGVTT
jgi:hypothetical protein